MSNQLIQLEKWRFNFLDDMNERFNAISILNPKPNEEWLKVFKSQMDLVFAHPNVVESFNLKSTPQYSYSERDQRIAVLDTTEVDFEIIEPFVSKVVKDVTEKIYPEILKKQEEDKERFEQALEEEREAKKKKREHLDKKFNKDK